MSLFGGLTAQPRNRNLVEFKAGKMNLRDNMVYPDKRKGLVYLYQGSDMLMHLCWKERSSNRPEDDLVIFPDEIEFKKITQNTTGRVYILKWKSNNRKLFFWMQEPKDDNDQEFCRKINDFLNHPPTPGFGDDESSRTHPLQPFMERMASGGAGGIDPNDLTNVLNEMNPTDFASLLSSFGRGGGGAASLMQNLRRSGGSTGGSTQQRTAPSIQNPDTRPNTAPARTRPTGSTTASTNRNNGSSSPSATPTNTTKSTTPKAGSIQMSALTNVLASLGNNTTNQETTTTTDTSKSSIDLCDIMNCENLISLLSNKNVQEKIRIHLSEEISIPNTEKEFKDSINSPEFRQIVKAFSTVLQSGELTSILPQFDFPDEVIQAVNQRDLQAFAIALENYYQTSNQTKSTDNTMDTN